MTTSTLYPAYEPIHNSYPPVTPPYPSPASMLPEEISTIFVVGFPDDMHEREFQNMFIFSAGFEAATLKIPKDEDDDLATNKKQIIGFAKFRTRLEAMEAKEIINGRKVDAEKGSVLKAEMAKKNLHSNNKRHPSTHDILTTGYYGNGWDASYVEKRPASISLKRATSPPNAKSIYEAFHSVPACHAPFTSHVTHASPPLLPAHPGFFSSSIDFRTREDMAHRVDNSYTALKPMESKGSRQSSMFAIH
ncbi:hypothetical protein DM01DRAFT_1331716 [Hesseltinella vesiculosa]|uniref:RRM domain-containing protein n=1 Tax=Hesseltinella vesiculosa TaxID=101127 RepID=A0A1X2GXE1_9FUNG|nr:hypothetical protein DM01DRAFT_1331716 [Hesseltinella vesiculosa]